MSNTLAEIWRDQRPILEDKSFRQIIQLAGDGRLRDGSKASQELRDWLGVIPLDRLRRCVEECLTESFDDASLALQDAANEIRARLGFEVARGRYRGTKGEIGNDGLWRASDGFALLVEIKTTDAYRINLNTLAGYRNALVRDGKIELEKSSILIGVGRQDTGDLEAQIRGSRHAWDVRLISLESLLRLAQVKEELDDLSTSAKINQLLRPMEYTRLDAIVELLFAAKQDLETSEPITPPVEEQHARATAPVSPKELEAARDAAVLRIASKLNCKFIRQTRALRTSGDSGVRLVCLASQRYEGAAGAANYWFGFTPSQRNFVSEASKGWVALVCGVSGRVILVDWPRFRSWLPEFWTTPPSPADDEQLRHWHVYLNDYGSRVELMKAGGGELLDLRDFVLPTT